LKKKRGLEVVENRSTKQLGGGKFQKGNGGDNKLFLEKKKEKKRVGWRIFWSGRNQKGAYQKPKRGPGKKVSTLHKVTRNKERRYFEVGKNGVRSEQPTEWRCKSPAGKKRKERRAV